MKLSHIIIGKAKEPLEYVNSCEAVQNKGLKGDRYYYQQGTFNKPQFNQNVRDISILPFQSLQECNLRLDINLDFKDLRRNLIIKDFDYNLLKEKEFQIGSATFKIVRTAPPCKYLARMLGVDIMNGLKYIGGYRAKVIKSGIITVEDTINY
jgi:MOSC domain-containing protein YiiM